MKLARLANSPWISRGLISREAPWPAACRATHSWSAEIRPMATRLPNRTAIGIESTSKLGIPTTKRRKVSSQPRFFERDFSATTKK
jgi:hypothetical protein